MARTMLSRNVKEAVRQLLPYFVAKDRQNVLGGDLLPSEMIGENLGSPRRYYDTLYAWTVKAMMVEAAKIVGGVAPNLCRNGSFEQTEAGFTNQPKYWTAVLDMALVDDMPGPG